MGTTVDTWAGSRFLHAKFQLPDLPSLPRHRVLESIRSGSNKPFTLVVAPAGSGKTTALAQFARSSGVPCAWYRAERTESDPRHLLRHLEHALVGVVPDLPGGWGSAEEAQQALGGVAERRRTLLVIDDLHELRGTPAEATLEKLVTQLPPWLGIATATRHSPGMNLTKLRLSGQLAEITGDDLRWRTWEVERLYRDFYREPLRPEDAAQLTLRTEGWAAGLQLFHLASAELPVARKSKLIEQLHSRPGWVRDYLTRNVLDRLPPELFDFLVDTCVLGRLEPELCDALRGRNDSSVHLAELDERRLFTIPREDGNGYRYHEVLRAYLEHALRERDGAVGVRRRYWRAGRLLDEVGASPEALYAYTRAESWGDAARLLGKGRVLRSDTESHVLPLLPDWFVSSDPWLGLARARALLGDGQLESAVTAYRKAEENFGSAPDAETCRRERTSVQQWLDPRELPAHAATDHLRAAVRRDPAAIRDQSQRSDVPADLLVGSVSALLAGDMDGARRLARTASAHTENEMFAIVAARTLEHIADLAAGRPTDPHDMLTAAATLEQLDLPWMARLARAIAGAQTGAPAAEVESLLDVLRDHDDPWGPPLVALVAGIAFVIRGEPQLAWLIEAAARFHELAAGTLEAWSRAWWALGSAYDGGSEALPRAEQAIVSARSSGVPGAEAIAELAVAVTSGDEAARSRAQHLATNLGMQLPYPSPDPAQDDPHAPSRLSCFGGFSMILEGRAIDAQRMKPQARNALCLLALEAGTPVHRERLSEAIWPGEDGTVVKRRIQVLVSTIRRKLEPDATAGDWTYLIRRGEAYMLELPPGTQSDIAEFDEALARAERARSAGRREEERQALERAFELYKGELLPEIGPAEWVIEPRERYRHRFAQLVQALAPLQAERGQEARCTDTLRAGLEADRYRSRLWELLVHAYEQIGDPAAAARTRAEHAAVLAELGLEI